MADSEFNIKVGVKVDASGIQEQLNRIKGNKLQVDIDTKNANKAIRSIRKELERLAKIKFELNDVGTASMSSKSSSSTSKAKKDAENMNESFKELLSLQQAIKEGWQEIASLDSKQLRPKDYAKSVKLFKDEINNLMAEYNNIYAEVGKNLSKSQKDILNKNFNADIPGVKQTNESYKELEKVASAISKAEIKIASLDGVVNADEIKTYTNQLEVLRGTYNKLKDSLNGQLSTAQFAKIASSAEDVVKKIELLDSKINDSKRNAAKKIEQDLLAGNGNGGDILKLYNNSARKFKSITDANEDSIAAMKRIKDAKEDLFKTFADNHNSIDSKTQQEQLAYYSELVSKHKTLIDAVKSGNNIFQENINMEKDAAAAAKAEASAQKEAVAAMQLRAKANNLSLSMDVWLQKNSKAADEFGRKIRALQMELKSCDATRLSGIQSEFKTITMQAEAAGKTGMSMTDRLRMQFTRLSSYFGAASVMIAGVQTLKEGFQNVLDIDTKMTDLKRVTDLTSSQYSDVYDTLINSAQKYGATLTDLISQTADWSRSGFSDPNTAAKLAEITSMYQHIADLDADTSMENILTAYKGFEPELKKQFNGDASAAAEHIADVYNIIDNNYATTAADIGEAVKRSASALSVAGNSLEETAGMITAITEVTQDPEKAGNSLKVLSMRLRGMKGELQDLGEETDENVENISQMQGKILNLTHGKVNIFDNNGGFKSTYKIMQGIADIYDDLSDTDKADLLETIAGKNRANEVAAMLSNFKRAEEATKDGLNSSGSAMAENAKYADSLQGRLDKLTSSLQALSSASMDSGFLKGLISGATEAINAVNKIVETIGIIPTVTTAVASAVSLAGKGMFKVITDNAGKSNMQLNGWAKHIVSSFEDVSSTSVQVFAEMFNKINTEFGNNKTFNFNTKKIKGANGGINFVTNLDSDLSKLKEYKYVIETLKKNQKDGQDINFDFAMDKYLSSASTSAQEFAKSWDLSSDALGAFSEKQIEATGVISKTSSSMTNAKNIISAYNNVIDESGQAQSKFASAISTFNPKLGNYLSGLKSGEASLLGYGTQLAFATAKTLTLEAATLALNAALTFGISMLVSAGVSALMSWINRADELSDKIDDITTKYKQQKEELQNSKKTIDDVSDSYERLSQGVNPTTNDNITLSNDEYKEYIDIVNQIADTFPTLVSGYDAQGNAILSCAGSVDKLNDAYKKAANNNYNDVLKEANNFIKDFKNKSDKLEADNEFGQFWDTVPFVSNDMRKDSYDTLKDLISDTENFDDKMSDLISHADWDFNLDAYDKLNEIAQAFENAGIERKNFFESDGDFVKRAITDNKKVAKQIVSDYEEQMNATSKNMQTATEAYFSKAFLNGKYSNISKNMQNVMNQMIPNLGYDYFSQFDNAEDMYDSLDKILSSVNSVSGKDKTFKTYFDLQAKVNNDECTVGEYVNNLNDVSSVVDGLDIDKNAKKALKLSLQLNDNDIKKQYTSLKNKLAKSGIDKDVAKQFADGLTATELEATVDLSASGEINLKDIDTKNLDKSIKQKIQDYAKYLEATRFTLDIKTETEDLKNLNTALSESRIATGLTQESIENIQNRYKGLDGYNPAAIFEKTTTGVRLNTKALQSLEKQYVATNKAANDQKLGAFAKRYKEIEALREKERSGSDKYKDYTKQLEDLNNEIEAAKMAAAAYDGLTSSYNEWLNAKSGGQAGDMYNDIISGAESAKKLASAGKWGNTELQSYIEMFSAPDSLDNATPEQYAAAWGSAISKANRYFKEGTAGIDSFISDIAAADSRLVKMNDQGVWEIQPNFDVKDWAKAAGVAESTVESIFGQMEEYGFDVPIGIEEESIDDLVSKADAASNALKSSMGQDFDIKVNTDVSSTKEASSEIENLKKQRDDINNSSATVEVKEQGVEAVNSAIEAVINKQIELEQPAYMQLDTSQVKSTMTDALTALQNYQNAVDNVKNLEMQQDAGIEIDTSQLDDAKKKVDETAEAIAKLDGKQKVAIGLEASDSVEDVKKKIESGKVKLTVDTDVNKSATQELASNLEKIKDKDVTVTVKVKGLDDVKTLNKQINIAAKVDGTVKDLTAFADAAKQLKDVDDDTVKVVTASLYGNLAQNDNLDSLQKFIDGAKELENVDSSFVTVNATFDGNLKEKSSDIENMEKFAKGAKALQDAPSSSVTVEANLKGEGVGNNIFGDNSTLDNIKKFADGAKTLQGIGDAKVTIEANLKGEGVGDNIFGDNSKLDNIKKFAEGAKALQGVGDASVNITANLDGKGVGDNIFGDNLTLDNLEKFAKAAERLKGVEDAKVSITANLNGSGVGNNIFGDNSTLDNLDKFADGAKSLKDVGSVKADVEVNLSGEGIGNDFFGNNSTLDNLEKFANGAEKLKGIGNISTNVSANLSSSGVGDDIFGSNSAIDNLDKFADGAKKLSGLDDVDVSIIANLKGNGVGNNIFGDNPTLDNLEKFAKAAKKLEGVGDVDASVNVGLKGDGVGNDIFGSNSTIDNLDKFADGAKKLQGVGDASVDIEANLKGDIDDSTVDNLSKFAKGAKALQDVEDVSVNVTANLESTGVSNNVFGDNSALDNINRFARAAERLKGVEDVKVNVSASLDSSGVGNDIFGNNSVLDNMSKFAKGANALKNVGDVKAKVSASLSGDGIGNDIFGSNSTIDNLKKFADGAKSLKGIGDVSAKVSANLDGNIGNGIGGGNSKIDNLSAFAKGAKQLDGVNDKSVTISANLNGNIGNSSDLINNLPSFASTAKTLQGVKDKSVTVTASVGGDITSDKVSTLSKFGSVVSSLPSSKTVAVNTNVDTGAISNIQSALQGLTNSGLMHNYTATITVKTNVDTSAVDAYSPSDKPGKVTYDVDASKVNSWSAPPKFGTVTYTPSVGALTDSQLHKTGTITYKAAVVGKVSDVNGTAHANGTAGHAFKNGDWSTKDSGTALMGELGQELIVRDGHFFTVGDNGAEFVPYKKGDIIFNHKQTEELFKNGYVTSGGGRGVAMASGTAFANVGHGTWRPGGIGGGYSGGGSSYSGARSSGSSSSSNSGSNSNANKEAEKSEQTLDWIETALNRVERAISRLDKTATSTYKNWTKRGTALNDQINQTRREIDLQNQAYNRYIQQANSVGLDAGYAAKVRDGTIDIEKITDDDLNNKISEYKQWYEKALDCLDAIDDLRESESKLYEQRFENVSTKYDGYLGVIQHEKDMLDEFVSQTETAGYITSGKYYDAMSDNAKKQQEELKKQRDEMVAELNNAVNSGTIEKYGEAWYSMVNSVDEVTKSIEECNTSLLEYQKNLRELDWQIFDLIQDKISKVADESEFLINLMSNKKLYEDNGQLTDEGMASMGQYGVKYNVYMAQADKYAKKIKELQADLAKDPYNQDIANQLQEYIEAQQEAILNAEDMKNSIKDMVSDGIDKELDSLQKLIDKRNDALDAAKDLYDYQKKVKEQTKDIASLEKQMAAYQGDASEETKAKIQQIKVDLEEAKSDLEETEYEQYISDQQKMLDDLYTDYETILNQRLDDIDALMADMISEINNNASTIGATIESQADKVGYTLSESMNTIWLSGNGSISNVITMYGTKFDTALTTTNTALGYINTNIQNMIAQLNKIAGTKIKAAGTSSAATEKPKPTPAPAPAPQPQQKPQPKQVTVGGMINAGGARIYADSYGNGGGRQTFGNDPIYTVLQERNGYVLTRWHKLSSGYTGWFKKSDVSAYALGAKNIRNNEMAWTQENGSEMIMRPSDGAILTPLAKNDSVLTSAASSNIWNMANNPSDFIKDNLDFDKIDTGANVGNKTTYTQNLDKVIFNLPNVKNYDELLKSMQHDKNFERLIMSMTIDPIVGKSSLAKGKAIR